MLTNQTKPYRTMIDSVLAISIYAMLFAIALLVIWLMAAGSITLMAGALLIFVLALCGRADHKHNNSKS